MNQLITGDVRALWRMRMQGVIQTREAQTYSTYDKATDQQQKHITQDTSTNTHLP